MKKLTPLILMLFIFVFTAKAQWTINGTNIYNSNTGFVGIGTGATVPTYKLQVAGGAIAMDADQPLRGAGVWLISGNATQVTVGTANAGIGLRFDAGAANRMFINGTNGNIGMGTITPAARLSFANVDATTLAEGIAWYNPTPLAYGIYKTAGTWVAPNYQQLKMSFETGIILDPGSAYGKSYVDIQGSGLRVSLGSVGIGTTTVAANTKLEVVGAATGTGPTIRASGGGDVLLNSGGSVFFDGNYSYAAGSYIRPVAANTQGFFTTGIERLRITPTGSIGIGTAAPIGLLEIKGPYAGNSQLNINTTSSNAELRFSDNGTTKGFVWFNKLDDTMAFGRGSEANSIFVNPSGNFGIGVKNPGTFKLAVEGKIGAREVNINTTTPWPDYVFNPGHKLLSLEEIKTYIEKNKHLPEVPSAKEIETNGVNLGEMNILLLKKVEELTLYMLDLKKENDLLKSRMEKIENKK
jgi:hypothetical protein